MKIPKSKRPPSISEMGKTYLKLRRYQFEIFKCRKPGIVVLHWSRQIGKSYTLAAIAVDRAIRDTNRLVTVLSNSRDNGVEFLEKCHEVCRLLDKVLKDTGTQVESEDMSPDLDYDNMRFEIRFKMIDRGVECMSRIKVLAANPRTARGFSGDLILDEFAFHENSAAIWEAAEPILAANPDFMCRIASTGNGKHNMFYRMAAPISVSGSTRALARNRPAPSSDGGNVSTQPSGEGLETTKCSARARNTARGGACAPQGRARCPSATQKDESDSNGLVDHIEGTAADVVQPGVDNDEGDRKKSSSKKSSLLTSQAGFVLSRITRTQAYHDWNVKIYDPATRKETTPDAARAVALDKRAYDQNYECAFADENLTLLSHELISAAERDDSGEIAEQDWTPSQLARLRDATGPLFAGFDVARRGDLSVITVLEKLGDLHLVRAILRIRDMRLPDQQLRLGEICRLPKFTRAAIDMTGLGLGLFEFAQKEFGAARIHGINFGTTVPATRVIQAEGRKAPSVRVTEALALELLRCYEDRRIQHPGDARLRDDLRKPEKVTSPGGRVSIAATRDEAGHADHFWSFALAIEAAAKTELPFAFEAVEIRKKGCLI